MQDFKRYHEAVAFLEGLSNISRTDEGNFMNAVKDHSIFLRRMRFFLDLLGMPERSAKYIHITGTSGKGSVSTLVHEALVASGKNAGLFTSPFVTTTIEKIKVGEYYISPDEFADLTDYLKPFILKAYSECPFGGPTYFEIILAIGFLYFKKKKCEFVVLEVGMGGRFDATNVIPAPLVSAVTSIDYDHTHILGKTLSKIANDKAGIIKKGSIFWTAETRPHILSIFKKICKAEGVPFNAVPKSADYRIQNALLATNICKSVGLSDSEIESGIPKAKLPARFEIVSKMPFVVIDGAHNRQKIRSTVFSAKDLCVKKIHLVIALSGNKDCEQILREIIPIADTVALTRFQTPYRKCANPASLLKISRPFLKKETKAEVYLDPVLALESVLKKAKAEDLVLVTGSFFLAGELREKWFPEVEILKKRQSF